MSDVRLRTEDLSVGYNGRELIRGIALSLRPGEIMTLIGPNGAGKSTILKSVIRQLALVRGTVCLDGRDMAGLREGDVARRMSVVMTSHISPELMTCFDVAATGRYPYTGRLGILTREDREKVAQCLELVHAAELADQDFSRISDGQRQRVLLARALCQEPEVLVLDEPTSFLDIRHKLELLAILKDMVRRRRLAVLMSLHELDLAQKISDQVVCVHGDKIERQGPPEEIFTPDYMRQLYGGARGSYNALFGSLELEAVAGAPEVFVIGGGGAGIPVYRRLQRQGIPFAAGVLQENDLDFPVASALAAEVVAEKRFQPIGEASLRRAAAVMADCRRVLCPLTEFGPFNEGNRQLLRLAGEAGTLEEWPAGENFKNPAGIS
ncbi:MAG: ABC transporter ATP-binding protein [Oscillospiraceae bacterium]|jgi:iron complex transport system ATP-binding protein|nr:ABC transporter ATP-binding protein [Oscillospiraceae bacterium]